MKVSVEEQKLNDFFPKLISFVQGIKILHKEGDPKAKIRMPEITGEIRIKINKNLTEDQQEKMKQFGFKYCNSDKEWIF